jgi:cell volume regulation protein A
MDTGELILVGSALLTAGLLASLVAVRVRVPSLVLFLGVGMLLGSDGLGWLPFDDYEMAQTIGIVALALILFEGGLTAGFIEIRPVLLPAISLALFGTMLTAAITRWRVVLLRPVAARGAARRRDPQLDRRRGDLRAAARVDAAPPPGPHARGRVGLQRPDRRAARPGLHRVDRAPDYGLADLAVLFVQEIAIGFAAGASSAGWPSRASAGRRS